MLALLQGPTHIPFWEHPTALAVILIVGLVALLGGAHGMVDGASALARRLGISPLMIGLTIVAFGTSAPELALNVVAVANSEEGARLAWGNVVGSNMANIGLVLGLACLVVPLRLRGRVLRQDLPILLGVTVVFAVMAWLTPGITAVEGIVLLVGMLGVGIAWFVLARAQPHDELSMEATESAYDTDKPPLWKAAVLTFGGLAIMLAGARGTEYGAINIARHIGMSEAVIGLTIIAIATSLPEVATAVVASRKGEGDLVIGTVIGSNLFNILLVIGVTSLVRTIPLPDDGTAWTVWAMLGFTLLLGAVYGRRHTLGRAWGFMGLALWIAVMVCSVTTSTPRVHHDQAQPSHDEGIHLNAPGVLPP